MLEAGPKLAPSDIRRIFTQTARADIATGSTPNEAYGLGKLDAKAAVALAEDEPEGCAASGGDPWTVFILAALAIVYQRSRR